MYEKRLSSGRVICVKIKPNRTPEQKAADRAAAYQKQLEMRRGELVSLRSNEWADRSCLTCGDIFWSKSKAHRRCNRCADSIFGMEYQRRKQTYRKNSRTLR